MAVPALSQVVCSGETTLVGSVLVSNSTRLDLPVLLGPDRDTNKHVLYTVGPFNQAITTVLPGLIHVIVEKVMSAAQLTLGWTYAKPQE